VEEIVHLNGSLVPLSQARLSPLDHGFLYGYGLFETMRAYSGHIFRLEGHLARLRRAAAFLGLGLDHLPDLSRALYDTLGANHLMNARIRLTLSGGAGEPVPDVTACREPTLLITAREYAPHPDSVYRQGFRVAVSAISRNTRSPLSGLKTLSYLDNLLARREARLAGVDEAIMLNEQGFVAEGSTSNVFLVSGNALRTPARIAASSPGSPAAWSWSWPGPPAWPPLKRRWPPASSPWPTRPSAPTRSSRSCPSLRSTGGLSAGECPVRLRQS
jgi:branched-subunit amino acid aminotransferase/4-amino-4-deoxychorismate lyase